MQTGRKVFLLVIAGVVTCGMYLFMDDDLGRPDRPIRLDLGPPVYVPVCGDPHRARFTICSGPIRANCVVDGDTFWFEGTKIRISDIDAPEISEPRCPSERQAGETAKRRLLELLNEGSFSGRDAGQGGTCPKLGWSPPELVQLNGAMAGRD